ncbi:MAG: hypothetical protein KBT34_01315 [Prevotella sp.]|nr:hypothetical protein [Candidatus Prevotella equi]
MKRFLKIFTVTIFSLVAALLLAMGGFACYLTTDKGQAWLKATLLETLRQTLDTNLEVDYIGANPFSGDFTLYGVRMDDRQSVRMLEVDTLHAEVKVMKLLDKMVDIDEINLAGATAVLYKESKDSAANYQFVLDALKPKKKKKKSPFRFVMELKKAELSRTKVQWDIKDAPAKAQGKLDGNHLKLELQHITLKGRLEEKNTIDAGITDLKAKECRSNMRLSVNRMHFRTLRKRNINAVIQGLWYAYQDKRVTCKRLEVQQMHGFLDPVQPLTLKAEQLTYFCNNGKPRKNHNRPNRGFFDPGHLDAVMSLEATVHSMKKDSVHITLNKLKAYDKGSGLDLRNVNAFVAISGNNITVTRLNIALPTSLLTARRIDIATVPSATATVPSVSTEGTPPFALRVSPFLLTGKVVLKDIHRPFGPVLSNFTTPLNLSVVCAGTLDRFTFSDIHVTNKDKRLRITAEGDLCDVTKKKALTLHFWNIHMDARSGVQVQIVNHFKKKVRLKMMRQLEHVGDVHYDGRVGVAYKRVDVGGVATCKYAKINFDFYLDGFKKRMIGTMNADSIGLGAIMNVKGLWLGKTKASYEIVTSREVKKKVKAELKGRLPIGKAAVTVADARMKKLLVHDIATNIVSDGATASGELSVKHSLIDVDATFFYTQTDDKQELRVKPKLRLHKSDKKRQKQEKAAAVKEQKGDETATTEKKEKKGLFNFLKKKSNNI